MRKIIRFYVCLLITFLLGSSFIRSGEKSIDDEEFGRLNIGLVVPDELEGFSAEHLTKIQSKLLALLNQSGVSSVNAENGIVMYPMISIFNEQQISPGLQSMTVIDGEIYLYIKQVDDKIVFASTSKKIKGSGRTREQAINNLISSIPTRSSEYNNFIIDSKRKIIDYYEKKCDMLISKADQLSKSNQHAEALSMLFNIPEETKCFEKVKDKSLEIYRNYQKYTCKKVITDAKARLMANQYEEGFRILSKVDPSSDCASEANQLYIKHGKEVDANVDRYWNFWEKIYTNTIEAQKYRWKAMSEMAVLYLTDHRIGYEYHTIIR